MVETNECSKDHCFHCFDTLYCHLNPSAIPIDPEFSDDKYPLFVTWNTITSGGNTRLRGCIGSFQPLNLRDGLAEYALISGLNDSRFRPIRSNELHKLECGVSLLTDFQDVPTYLDWDIGTHGIYISFPHPSTFPSLASMSSSGETTPSSSSTTVNLSSSINKPKSRGSIGSSARMLTATYLPDIAPSQGWNRVETIDSAIRKAGYDGRITEDIRRSIKLRTYESKKASVTWDEYWEWRQARLAEVES